MHRNDLGKMNLKIRPPEFNHSGGLTAVSQELGTALAK